MRLCGHSCLVGYGTVFNTTPATGAQVHVDTARTLFDFYFEISSRTFNRLQIRIRNDFDVDVPADLDQFGRDNSHGTIVGGEGLVQLGHNTPDGRAFLQQVYIVS